jgi:hypothetical protein
MISWSGSRALAVTALLDHEERSSDLNAPGTPHPGIFFPRAVFAPDATRNGNIKFGYGRLA